MGRSCATRTWACCVPHYSSSQELLPITPTPGCPQFALYHSLSALNLSITRISEVFVVLFPSLAPEKLGSPSHLQPLPTEKGQFDLVTGIHGPSFQQRAKIIPPSSRIVTRIPYTTAIPVTVACASTTRQASHPQRVYMNGDFPDTTYTQRGIQPVSRVSQWFLRLSEECYTTLRLRLDPSSTSKHHSSAIAMTVACGHFSTCPIGFGDYCCTQLL